MINFKKILNENLLLKITSLNTIVITIQLFISLIVQRILAVTLGETGISVIGQLRNLTQIITSTSSFGTFNGIVKYTSEYWEDKNKLHQLFNATIVLGILGSLLSFIILFFNAPWITKELFGNLEFLFLIKLFAFLIPAFGINRIFQGVIHGFSDYKKYAQIELISYLVSTILLLIFLYYYQLEGVLWSIIITPIIQLTVMFYVYYKVIIAYVPLKKNNLKMPFGRELMSFAIMSFVSTILVNYVELDIRTTISNEVNVNEAGYWTAMTFISKNYMVFSASLFTLYVIPKFSRIYEGEIFFKEVISIYKTLLPLFGLGMLLVYIFRKTVIDIIYPSFWGIEPLFKWQLLGDFIRLAALVVAHQFLAKKMIKSFIITELISISLFYFLSKYLVVMYGAEGVVMAHFYRYIVYFIVVIVVVLHYFKTQKRMI